jgi:putative Mn2+ efflux pump MntP
MDATTIWLIALGLAMDAFAIAVSNGAAAKRIHLWHALRMALMFGVFQAGMLLLGALMGTAVSRQLTSLAYWIAFFVIGAIGVNMIVSGFRNEKAKQEAVRIGTLLMLALATSIDALAVGVTLSFLRADIGVAAVIVGGVALVLSFVGAFVGKFLSAVIGKRGELIGGVILIAIAVKILVENVFS